MVEEKPVRRWSRRRAAIAAAALLALTVAGIVIARDNDRPHKPATQAQSSQAVPTSAVIPESQLNNFCSSYPVLPATQPNATNTGVPPSLDLTTKGDMTVDKVGAIVTGLWIKGTLTITANNVTVEDNKIEGAASGWYGIEIGNGVVGTRIIDNEIWGDNGGYIGIDVHNAGNASTPTFICGNHLHNWENDITTGPNMMVQANFIDAMQNNRGDSDADGIENYYGGNTKFWGNNIRAYGPDGSSTAGINSALNITATGVNISGVQINGNWLAGGGTTLDLDQQGATLTNVTMTGNTFYRSPPPRYGPLNIHDDHMISAWTSNNWSDGSVLSQSE